MKLSKFYLLFVIAIAITVSSARRRPQKDFREEPNTTPATSGPKPNTTVCYEDVGCFSNEPPFTNAGLYLPVAPELINTEFLLFTPKNFDQEDMISYKDKDTIRNSRFDPDLPIKIIIHGFSNNRTSPWINILRDALFKIENVNVIVTDWGAGAVFPNYHNSTANTRLVGRQVCLLIKSINEVFYQSTNKKMHVHCIGHSLGAHTCAYASSYCSSSFDRISGMDPAGPFFEDTDPAVRLDPSDAKFVDAIHTNGGSLLTGSFGIVAPVGDVDFYPNGGKTQPGCPGLTSIIGGLFGGAADPTSAVGCSHGKGYWYYIESITSHCSFMGFSCPSQDLFDKGQCLSCGDRDCAQMGYFSNNYKARGSLYLSTNSFEPFCGYNYLFQLHVTPDSAKTAGELILQINPDAENITKSITTTNDDIKPNDVLSRVFVANKDLTDKDKLNLRFNKKAKPFFGSDPNALKFTFDRVKITHVEVDEKLSDCTTVQTIEDKKQVFLNIEEKDCSV